MYKECIQLTRQFAFCPNAFRVDTYKGCDMGCRYCFANMEWNRDLSNNWDFADMKKIEYVFKRALDRDRESKDILVELIRHRVPIHCGGMSDPFQSREWTCELTYRLIELSNKYNYPVQFSTKTDFLDEKYYKVLNPELHAFQISLMGYDDDYIRKWERNTPTAKQRLEFAKELKKRGFWVGIRIQPIIDISQVVKLCYNLDRNVNYVTLEHIKSQTAVTQTMETLNSYYTQDELDRLFYINHAKLEMRKHIREENIRQIKVILNGKGIKVGVGDNDLHYMSDTRCCCGTDTINSNFDNYMKYNLTYCCTGKSDTDTFIPKTNPRKNINDKKYGLVIDCKQYVDDYITEHIDYCGDRKNEVINELGLKIVRPKKLF